MNWSLMIVRMQYKYIHWQINQVLNPPGKRWRWPKGASQSFFCRAPCRQPPSLGWTCSQRCASPGYCDNVKKIIYLALTHEIGLEDWKHCGSSTLKHQILQTHTYELTHGRTVHTPPLQGPFFPPTSFYLHPSQRDESIISPSTAAVPLKHRATLKLRLIYLFHFHGLLTKSNSVWIHRRQTPRAQ